jgi:hypothetical protein
MPVCFATGVKPKFITTLCIANELARNERSQPNVCSFEWRHLRFGGPSFQLFCIPNHDFIFCFGEAGRGWRFDCFNDKWFSAVLFILGGFTRLRVWRYGTPNAL